jgi:hypothetical protein
MGRMMPSPSDGCRSVRTRIEPDRSVVWTVAGADVFDKLRSTADAAMAEASFTAVGK